MKLELTKNEQTVYKKIKTQFNLWVGGFPDPLQKLMPTPRQFVEFEFTKIIALLPYWCNALYPVSHKNTINLGLAGVFGWWYYYLQDEIIDHIQPSNTILIAHLALTQALNIYHQLNLSPTHSTTLQQLLTISATAHATELTTRLTSCTDLTPNHLSSWTPDLLLSRAAPFHLPLQAQHHLTPTAAIPLQHITDALNNFTLARQLGDDLTDWSIDLRRGQLNYISAQLIQHINHQDPTTIQKPIPLDPDWIQGYTLDPTADPFWQRIQTQTLAYIQNSLSILDPYPCTRLKQTLTYQQQKLTLAFNQANATRTTLRKMLTGQ